jgi:hypothetical protein
MEKRIVREALVNFGDDAQVGAQFLTLAREHCVLGRGQVDENEQLGCPRILFDAYRLFQQAGDAASAARAKDMLLGPANGMSETEYGRLAGEMR